MWVKTELLQCLYSTLLASQKLKSTIRSWVMLFITTEELELQGVDCKEASQITFHNKLLTRGLDFSKKARQRVIGFCQDYLDANLFCLVVESQWYLTVWIEDKNTNFTEKDRNFHTQSIKDSSLKSSSSTAETRFEDDHIDKTDEQSPRQQASSLPLQGESTTRDLVPTQEKRDLESLPLDESPLNQQNPRKKRRKRRYRGISY